jgi:predicted AAA+ superfamily ATPase
MISLDKASQRKAAQNNPELFLKSQEAEPLILDEAQKVPDLFDEIKSLVDEHRRPGRFVLTGSTKFSSKIGIRESLTGRAAVLSMDSMTLRETLDSESEQTKNGDVKLEQILRYSELGGMPTACFHRDETLRSDYWDEWLETLCEQDLHPFSKGRLSGDLAHELLNLICRLEVPTPSELAKATGAQARRVQNHLDALENLFVIHSVEPHPESVGKPRYLVFDCGLATVLGANLDTRIRTFIHHQWRNEARFNGIKFKSPHFYLHRKGSFFDFVTTDPLTFFRLNTAPFPSKREIQKAEAQVRRYSEAKVIFLSATDEKAISITPQIQVRPIGSIV